MAKFENMYSKNKNNKYYTPKYGVKPILRYVTPNIKI